MSGSDRHAMSCHVCHVSIERRDKRDATFLTNDYEIDANVTQTRHWRDKRQK